MFSLVYLPCRSHAAGQRAGAGLEPLQRVEVPAGQEKTSLSGKVLLLTFSAASRTIQPRKFYHYVRPRHTN